VAKISVTTCLGKICSFAAIHSGLVTLMMKRNNKLLPSFLLEAVAKEHPQILGGLYMKSELKCRL